MEVSPLQSPVWQTDVLEMQKNTSIFPAQSFFFFFFSHILQKKDLLSNCMDVNAVPILQPSLTGFLLQ